MSVSQQLMKMRSGATNALLPIFEGISNIYLYEFLALDVVGMWVPRIGVSLWRGRIPYDGAKDPVNEGMNPLQLAAKHTWGNFKGLNWANFWEETGREFCTGPGVLMVPAAMFGILRRLNHRTAVEMQYDALKDFSQSFQAHLGKVEVTPGNVQEYRQQFKAWLLDRLEIDNKITPENKQVYVRKVNNGIQTRQSTNIEHLLDEWVGKLSNNAILKPGEKPSKKALNEFKELTGQLGEAIKDFNRKIDPHATDKTNNITFKQGEVGVKNWAWGDFAGQIERFSDYASSVFTRHGEQGGAKSLEQVAQEVFKQVRGTKALFAVLATALTGGYLFFLSKAVQHSKEYPANRLLKEDDVRGVESPESPVAQVGRQQPVMNFVPPQAPQVIAPRGASFMPNSPYAAPNPYAAAQRMTGPAPYPRGGNIRL